MDRYTRWGETVEQTLLVAHLLLQFVQTLLYRSQVLHLGLVVLPEQPHVGVVVHPLWTLWERLHRVGTPTQPLPDLLRPPQGSVIFVLALALVAEVVAVPTQEILPLPVQDRYPPPARNSRADEPGPLSPKVARRPLQGYRLHHFLPLTTWPAAVAVGEDYFVPVNEGTDGCHLLLRSPPTPREPTARF